MRRAAARSARSTEGTGLRDDERPRDTRLEEVPEVLCKAVNREGYHTEGATRQNEPCGEQSRMGRHPDTAGE
jgi:hypothetical protein